MSRSTSHMTQEARRGIRSRPRLTRNVAPGVHRLEHAYVNCYLLEEQDALTIVDTAHPRTWRPIVQAITALGRRPEDVRAIVLTHAHFDHLGFAGRARAEWGVPIFAHAEEDELAAHPYSYAHENPRLIYPIRHPKAIPALVGMMRAGALSVRGVTGLVPMLPGEVLDVPGHPRVVFTPGHTFGHCALSLPAADAVLSGDALVTFNPYTGGDGPQIVSGAATADSAMALASLDGLAETGASVLLPGHGEPWRNGSDAATAAARAAGPS
ncbi:MBL fold metallo-hydrolase [Agromyces salentinus]|uniref:MBL fold metallo-hydrolase n=1 Tax=Agromyces salentinus TaxID=269421 RepID=A0ABN2MGB1_9MICO|nr:MBL fold metallo-hydrolase [Agromyces salentinus]